MRHILTCAVAWALTAAPAAFGGEVSFTVKPTAAKDGDKVKVSFTVSAPTDVEVAVLGADGKVVRSLAAGVLGGRTRPGALEGRAGPGARVGRPGRCRQAL